MPTVANGIRYDWDVARAHAENVEIELDRGIVPGHDGILRLLGFMNHARMGSYQEALDAFAAGRDSVPDIVAHRRAGRRKGGPGLNARSKLDLRGFSAQGIAVTGSGLHWSAMDCRRSIVNTSRMEGLDSCWGMAR